MKKFITIRYAILLITLVVIITGIACNENEIKSIKEIGKVNKTSYFGSYRVYKWNDEISLPFPAPRAEAYTLPDYGRISCKTRSITDFRDYINTLKEEGWELLGTEVKERKEGDIYYTLIKDNMILSLIDQVPYGYLNIDYKLGCLEKDRKRALDKVEAAKLIQEYIDGIIDNEIRKEYGKVYRLVELDMGEAYEKLGIQSFAAFDREGGISNFFICKGSVNDAYFFEQAVTVDIDRDGELELITAESWGSGIFRIDLMLYKYGVPRGTSSQDKVLYMSCHTDYIPHKGYRELALVKISDSEVRLYGAEKVKGELVPKVDYGVLKYDGKHLYTEAKSFPFREGKRRGE